MPDPIALKRIKKELAEIKKNPPLDMSLGPTDDNNVYHWEGIMSGPEKSPYAGGIFKFSIDFPEDYPMHPPLIRFITKMYHPNIDPRSGTICVDLLSTKWSSVYDISKVILSITSLLNDPNPKSPLNPDSANLYEKDRTAYDKKVKEWVKKYASPENL